MENNTHVQFLQTTYVGVLVDALMQFNAEGVLDSVTARKREVNLASAKMRLPQFGITNPEEVFLKLAALYGCANWNITSDDNGFNAQTTTCKLCAMAKKAGAPSPCHMYCLDPMEGMVKACGNNITYTVKEALWNSDACTVRVDRKG